MQTPEGGTIKSIDDLIKSFTKTDSYRTYTRNLANDEIDDKAWSETGLDVKVKQTTNKYWNIVKNHISVAFFFSNKKKNSESEKHKNEKQKAKSTFLQKKVVFLSEKEWFIKKFEKEVGKPDSAEMAPFSTLEKDIQRRKKKAKDKHLYSEYKEPPRQDDMPDIVWNGSPLTCCCCISPVDNCDCKGHMVLPPRFIPIGFSYKKFRWLNYLQKIPLFKKFKTSIFTVPDKPFAQRLQEHLEAEAAVQQQLQEMNLKRGPEFCVFRCYHYYFPRGDMFSRYFQLKRDLYNAYKYKQPMVDEQVEVVEEKKPIKKGEPSISDEIIDGLYRSVSTQATTDEDGEFIMGDVSHILFGRGDASVLQDIEGTPYCVCSYQDIAKKKSLTVVKKIEDMLSISGIKKRVSKLTSNLMSSIVEIKDPGIPSNTRATQDPALDDYVESIIIPSKYKFVKDTKAEVCPCCKKYKEIRPVETDLIETDVIDSYDDYISNGLDSLLNDPFSSKQHRGADLRNFIEGLKTSDNLTKVSLNKENLTVEKLQKQIQQLENSVDNTATNIQLNEPIKGDTNESEVTKNKLSNSLEFLESIKPCCIDNLYKHLEIKISNERFIIKLLQDHILRRVYRSIYSIEKKRLQKIKDIKITSEDSAVKSIEENENLINDNIDLALDKAKEVVEITEKETESACANVKKINIIDSFKSSMNINMNKFSDFVKKQKSSLKKFFAKNIKDARLRSKSRKTLSLEDYKLKINNSLKKMNNALSSFFKRKGNASSNVIKRFETVKKDVNKLESSEDIKCDAEPPSDDTLQNIPDTRDSKSSEKEVFSVQYNSTCEFYSKHL